MRTFAGVLRYEFAMQVRRRAVWLSIGAVLLLTVVLFTSRLGPRGSIPDQDRALFLVGTASLFLPVAFGILMADRWRRDSSLGTLELLDSLPSRVGQRLWGKYAGSALGTLVPLFGAYAVSMLFIATRTGQPALVRFLPEILVLVVLPGLLFVAAFSIVCTEWLPVPLYSILFTGYWFWGNLVPPAKMPTLNCTPLTPLGEYPAAAFFAHTDTGCFRGRSIPIGWGVGSIGLMLAAGAMAMLALQIYLARRAAVR